MRLLETALPLLTVPMHTFAGGGRVRPNIASDLGILHLHAETVLLSVDIGGGGFWGGGGCCLGQRHLKEHAAVPEADE